jgi:RNA polymerase sigma-70 factor (ECF subfamily)
MSASLNEPLKRNIEDDDADIVRRCRHGDTEAFAVLVRKYQKKMLNVAYRMTGNYDDACDVVQEAFLSAYKAIEKFRGDARFSTWLCGIVMNQARTHLQNRAVQLHRTALSLDDPAQSEARSLMSESESRESAIPDRIDKRRLEVKVQACIGEIDSDQREVLVLRDIQGFSYEEIGAVLKLPSGTVRSRLFRARHELKERLIKVLGDPT